MIDPFDLRGPARGRCKFVDRDRLRIRMLYDVTTNHAFDKENYLNDLFKLDSR